MRYPTDSETENFIELPNERVKYYGHSPVQVLDTHFTWFGSVLRFAVPILVTCTRSTAGGCNVSGVYELMWGRYAMHDFLKTFRKEVLVWLKRHTEMVTSMIGRTSFIQ